MELDRGRKGGNQLGVITKCWYGVTGASPVHAARHVQSQFYSFSSIKVKFRNRD
jgi:hypothetical protein